MKIKSIMCNDVCCVNANAKISEVANLMNTNHIGCVPVCDDNNKICGIVTDRDILLRSIVCDKNIKETPVSDIMTCQVCSCNQEDDMTKAQKTMSENQVRRLPVCDCNNKVVGILTIGDLAQNDTKLGKQEVCTTIENICNCDGENKNAE